MPLKSKKHLEKLRELEAEGKLKAGTTDKWISETKVPIYKLPDRVAPKRKNQSNWTERNSNWSDKPRKRK
jgi:hypothetical protein